MLVNLKKLMLFALLALQTLLPHPVQASEPQAGVEPSTINISIYPFITYAPFYIAMEEGYYDDQNIRLEAHKMTPAARLVALARGELDVAAFMNSVGPLNAMAREGSVRVVADMNYIDPEGCPYSGFMARKDFPEAARMDTPEEFKSLRVSVTPLSSQEYHMDKLLSDKGLAPGLVDYTYVRDAAAESEALIKGSVDLISTSEPWVTRTLESGKAVVWNSSNDTLPEFQYAYMLYGSRLLKADPDLGKRFMIAHLKGVRQFNEGKTDRNLEILAKHTGLERDLLERACWPTFRDDGRITLQSILEFQDWAMKKGVLDSAVEADRIWVGDFTDHANRVLK